MTDYEEAPADEEHGCVREVLVRDYRKIIAWQRAHELVLEAYKATRPFPPEERYGLTSQLRRAACSVPANIVEGSSRSSKREYLRFLQIAWGSLKEVEYFLLLARDLECLSAEKHRDLTESVNDTFAPLHGLMKAVEKEA